MRVDVKQLSAAMDFASRYVGTQTSNVLLGWGWDKLKVRGTDLEKVVDIVLHWEGTEETAKLSIPPKIATSILKTMSGVVELSTNEYGLRIQSDTDDFEIRSVDESVNFYTNVEGNTIKIGADMLARGIKNVVYAIAEKSFSVPLTGVLFWSNGRNVMFVGTDSFRLVEHKEELIAGTEFKLLIPKSFAVNLLALLEYYAPTAVEVVYNEARAMFKFGDIVTSTALIQQAFPDYNNARIMPVEFTSTVEFDKDELTKAIKKVILFTKDANSMVLFKQDGNKIVLSSGKRDKWAGTTEVSFKSETGLGDFAINGYYLLDFLANMSTNTLTMRPSGVNKPILLSEDAVVRYVIRPLNQ